MIRLRPSKFSGYKYRLMAPYALAFVLVAGVGFQLTTNLLAEEVQSGDIILTTNKKVYEVGEEIRYTVVNNTSAAIAVANDCPEEPLDVYHEVDGQWQQIHDSATVSAKCDSGPVQYSVGPNGGSTSATYRYWPSLFSQAGKYRLLAPLAATGEQPQATFTVVGDSR